MGWAIISLGEIAILTYDSGLNIASNNVAEAYALMQGLKLVIDANIQSLIIVGDSRLVIGEIVSKTGVVEHTLDVILDRDKKIYHKLH